MYPNNQRFKLFLIPLLLALLSGCRQQDPALETFRHATRMKIFRHTATTDSLIFSSEDKEEISRFVGYISAAGSEAYKCGYEGLIILDYPDKPSTTLEFNTDEDCGHIVYSMQERIFYRHLTSEGLSRLRGMVKG